jgi:hypothetical protein
MSVLSRRRWQKVSRKRRLVCQITRCHIREGRNLKRMPSIKIFLSLGHNLCHIFTDCNSDTNSYLSLRFCKREGLKCLIFIAVEGQLLRIEGATWSA